MRGPCSSGVQRSRSSASSIWRTRAAGAPAAAPGGLADHAVGRQAVARWKAPHRRRPAAARSARQARSRRSPSAASRSASRARPRRPGPGRACRPARGNAAAAGRQRHAPRRMADQAAVARQRLAQLLVLRQRRRGCAHGRDSVARRQRRAAGGGIEGIAPRSVEVVVDLPRVDTAVVQVGQVALHRRRQPLLHALRATPLSGGPCAARHRLRQCAAA